VDAALTLTEADWGSLVKTPISGPTTAADKECVSGHCPRQLSSYAPSPTACASGLHTASVRSIGAR